MPGSSPIIRKQAQYRLATVGAVGVLGVGLSLIYRGTGLGFPCPWRFLTGTLCPFCGATRMGADLLTLDFSSAWSHNAFVLTWGLILGVATLAWAVEAIRGVAVRLPGVLGEPRVWWIGFAVSAVIFTVLRNL